MVGVNTTQESVLNGHHMENNCCKEAGRGQQLSVLAEGELILEQLGKCDSMW